MKALTEDENFELPMTPMIDIVFQLLIFFLLATTVKEEEMDITVRIPPGQQGAPAGASAARRISISVRKDGAFTFGGQAVNFEDLRKKLLEAGAASTKPVVTLRGDREAAYGAVAKVLQLCQEAKLENVNVQFIKER